MGIKQQRKIGVPSSDVKRKSNELGSREWAVLTREMGGRCVASMSLQHEYHHSLLSLTIRRFTSIFALLSLTPMCPVAAAYGTEISFEDKHS